MTLEEATKAVAAYNSHSWTFEVTDDGTVVVGGQDHSRATQEARAAGHNGPVRRYASHLGRLYSAD